jgi:hypothetical protein
MTETLSEQLDKVRQLYQSKPDETRVNNVGSLSRYFIWADKMRADFEALAQEQDLNNTIYVENCHIYISYWYSGLYVVIEGWRELDLHESNIDALLSSPYVDLLRRYRNAVFHYQKTYSDSRFMDLMLAGDAAVTWVHQLHAAFGDFFVDWWKANTKKRNT